LPRHSMFEFKGTIGPSNTVPAIHASYLLNRPQGNVEIEVDEYNVTIRLATKYESFGEVYYETLEFALAFFAIGAITTGAPVELRLNEWIETPFDHNEVDGTIQKTRGQIHHEDPDALPFTMLPEDYTFALAEGLRWSEDIAQNAFLRRAVLDFNHALKHSNNDVPIYLARALESVENYYGGEKAMIDALGVSSQTKLVKKIANDAQGGLHTRHASMIERMKPVERQQVIACANAVREIIQKFQMDVETNRFRREAG
jgi:hypothetical protein